MVSHLVYQGWEVYSFDLHFNYCRWGLDQIARQVANYIDKTFPASQPLDLVGLSMGDLISRYYVQRLGGIERVQRLVTISSPHRGTWLAYALPLASYVQMRPDSAFLQDLNQDVEKLEQIQFTSIWTPADFIIVPPQSSKLGVGKEIKLSVFTHAMMARDASSLEAVAKALYTPLKPKYADENRCGAK